MTTTKPHPDVPHPVDSTTRTCCSGIGGHTPDCKPDIPLPVGAVADADSWAFWDNEFRTFHGVDRILHNNAGEKIAEVRTSGVQLADGTIDLSSPPTIDVNLYTDDGLDALKAFALAAHIIAAGLEVDRWVQR